MYDSGICAICARLIQNEPLEQIISSSPEWKLLKSNKFLIHNKDFISSYILKQCSSEFMFNDKFLDSMMLDKDGIVFNKKDDSLVKVCKQCMSSLRNDSLTKNSL